MSIKNTQKNSTFNNKSGFNRKFIKKVNTTLNDLLSYSKDEDYKGYNKYDALQSKFLSILSFNNKYLRLVYSQVVMRSPINIRPILGIPKTKNPKGLALFAMAHLNKYRAYQKKENLQQAVELIEWLIKNPSENYKGICWGYQHPWQDVGFFAPANLPNRVVTYFVLSAIMELYEITKKQKYLDVTIDSVNFILNEPKVLFEDETKKCLSYVPDEAINWIVMDVSILCGSILSRISKYNPDEFFNQQAKKLVNFVVDKQTDYGAWFYTFPQGAHPRAHDNYHTGYILDAILDYSRNSGDNSYMDNYFRGLDYYEKNLFLKNGAPKWANNRTYPLDVHGSAQGIITFLKATEFDKKYYKIVENITSWAINNMFNNKKRYFYYQKTRFFRKPFTLMRWSNGWMARALSEIACRK